MPVETRNKGRAVSSIAPSDSASQPPKPFIRQDNSTNSSRESLVESDRYDNWFVAKPFLESFEQETVPLDQTDADNAAYKPQSCQRTELCRSIPDLNRRRQKIRAIGYRVYNWPRPPSLERFYPKQTAYDTYKTEFALLDDCIEFKPTHMLKNNAENRGENICMVVKYNHTKHTALRTVLKKLKNQIVKIDKKTDSSLLKDLRISWPGVPEFPDSSPNALYSKYQWEVATCIYRDVIERFLAYTFNYQKTAAGKQEEIDLVGSAMNDVCDDPLPAIQEDYESGNQTIGPEETSQGPSASMLFTPGTYGATQASQYSLREPPPLTKEAVEQLTRKERRKDTRVSIGGAQYYPAEESTIAPWESPLATRARAMEHRVGRTSGSLIAPMPYPLDARGRAITNAPETTSSRIGIAHQAEPRTTWKDQEEADDRGGPRRHSPPHIPTLTESVYGGSSRPYGFSISGGPSGSSRPPAPPPGGNEGVGSPPSGLSRPPAPPPGGAPFPQPGGGAPPPPPPQGGGGGGGPPPGPGGPAVQPGRRRRSGPPLLPPPLPAPPALQAAPQVSSRPQEIHFDWKIKTSDVVKPWSGKSDELPDYVLDLNILASQSPTIYNQLGQQVALRFTGIAKDWFNSLSPEACIYLTDNWGNMRDELLRVFLTRAWTDRT